MCNENAIALHAGGKEGCAISMLCVAGRAGVQNRWGGRRRLVWRVHAGERSGRGGGVTWANVAIAIDRESVCKQASRRGGRAMRIIVILVIGNDNDSAVDRGILFTITGEISDGGATGNKLGPKLRVRADGDGVLVSGSGSKGGCGGCELEI